MITVFILMISKEGVDGRRPQASRFPLWFVYMSFFFPTHDPLIKVLNPLPFLTSNKHHGRTNQIKRKERREREKKHGKNWAERGSTTTIPSVRKEAQQQQQQQKEPDVKEKEKCYKNVKGKARSEMERKKERKQKTAAVFVPSVELASLGVWLNMTSNTWEPLAVSSHAVSADRYCAVIYYKCSSFFFAPGRFPLWLLEKNQTKNPTFLRVKWRTPSLSIASAVWRWPSFIRFYTHTHTQLAVSFCCCCCCTTQRLVDIILAYRRLARFFDLWFNYKNKTLYTEESACGTEYIT